MLEEQESQHEIEKILSTYSDKISNEEEIEKLKKLLSVRQKLSRKELKKHKEQYLIVKSAFQLCQKEKKNLYQAKKRLKKLKKCSLNESSSLEIKRLKEKIAIYNKFITSKSTENIKIIFELYKKVLAKHRLFLLNITFALAYCLGVFVFGGIISYLDNRKYNFSCLISVIIIGIVGLIYILFYLKFYFHDQNFTWKVKLIKYLFYLAIWSFIYTFYLVLIFICYGVEENPYTAIPLVISLALLIISTTFDFITSSGFFDDIEAVLSLVAIIMISGYIIGSAFDTFFVKIINQILLVFASILLIYLVTKKFVMQQPKIDGAKLLYTLILLVGTICVCVLTLYNLFWNQDAASQDLFNAIMGVFAGLVGGALTLAGVAWTIKSEHVKMQEESAKAAKPLFALRQKDSFEVNHTIHGIRCEITISPASIKWYGYFINSNHSSLYILGVEIKETFYPLKSNNTILQNQEFTLVLKREENVNDSNDSVTLLIRDQIGNTHRYNIKYVYDQSLGVKRFNYAKELSELTDK